MKWPKEIPGSEGWRYREVFERQRWVFEHGGFKARIIHNWKMSEVFVEIERNGEVLRGGKITAGKEAIVGYALGELAKAMETTIKDLEQEAEEVKCSLVTLHRR